MTTSEMEMRGDKVCATCEWFRQSTDPEDQIRYNVTIGKCRRYPPIPMETINGMGLTGEWPPVAAVAWCGEWAPVTVNVPRRIKVNGVLLPCPCQVCSTRVAAGHPIIDEHG